MSFKKFFKKIFKCDNEFKHVSGNAFLFPPHLIKHRSIVKNNVEIEENKEKEKEAEENSPLFVKEECKCYSVVDKIIKKILEGKFNFSVVHSNINQFSMEDEFCELEFENIKIWYISKLSLWKVYSLMPNVDGVKGFPPITIEVFISGKCILICKEHKKAIEKIFKEKIAKAKIEMEEKAERERIEAIEKAERYLDE